MEEINVKVVRGVDGADCDIDVPIDVTVGDVIVGLIYYGFLDPDNPPAAINVLYGMDVYGMDGPKYNDRSKTVKEYGWQKGQTFVAVFEDVSG